MGPVKKASGASSASRTTGRRAGFGAFVDGVLAALAHLLVLASWAVTAAAVMGSLGVGRRMLMNSEFAWDTGRLPQPWAIPIGVVAIVLSHLAFKSTMRRYARGGAAYGPSVVAWAGIWLGVAWGAYNWPDPVQEGRRVGPSSGQSTPWDPFVWVAYYARLWLPGLVTLVTAALVLFSKNSPLVAFLRAWRRRGDERFLRKHGRTAPPA